MQLKKLGDASTTYGALRQLSCTDETRAIVPTGEEGCVGWNGQTDDAAPCRVISRVAGASRRVARQAKDGL